MSARSAVRPPSKLVALTSLGLALGASGCGAGVQYLVGWSSRETAVRTEQRTVNVTTQPPGLSVTRRDAAGNVIELGVSPARDVHSVEIEETKEIGHTTWLWVGAIAELVSGGLLAAEASATTAEPVDTGTTPTDTITERQAGGGVLVLAGIVDLVLALMQDETVVERRVKTPVQQLTYGVAPEGRPAQSRTLKVPDELLAHFAFEGLAPAKAAQGEAVAATEAEATKARTVTSGGSAVVADRSWIIAVMDVEDVNAGEAKQAIDRGLVRNLGDQLRVFIAQHGLRTIDRSAQEKALREQIKAMKSESYKSCYADECQVELGKALAASHILRTRITRFGSRCVLNGELIDLKAEVTTAASSSQGTCEAEGFLVMGEDVAKNLVRTR
ncbi:hypothetical protein L6R52_31230 [Myxococcota bacterium]|nr:hypothetical protein [Myxococcota bacterium]